MTTADGGYLDFQNTVLTVGGELNQIHKLTFADTGDMQDLSPTYITIYFLIYPLLSG